MASSVGGGAFPYAMQWVGGRKVLSQYNILINAIKLQKCTEIKRNNCKSFQICLPMISAHNKVKSKKKKSGKSFFIFLFPPVLFRGVTCVFIFVTVQPQMK